MTIIFYSAIKRRNSTKQPAGGTSYTGTLTNESGIVSPVIIMEFGNTAPSYNYAYITEFQRYYWINEITSIGGGLWRVSMSVDVLASFKTDIGNSVKYVLRSASDFDGGITDLKYPTKAGYKLKKSTDVLSGWAADPMFGRYVVGVVSPGGSFGSVNMFCLDNSQFITLRNAISPGNYYGAITDTDLKNLAITTSNPMQYIAFVRYYPFAVSQSSTTETMQLGNISVPNMPLLGNATYLKSYTFNLTDHPLAATRGEYLNCEPFSQRFITWLPVGMIHIPGLTANLTSINVSTIIDVMSGTGDLVISNGSDTYYRTSFVTGVDVPVAQIVSGNPLKVINGTISLFSAGASAIIGNIGGAVQSGVSAISDFMTANIPEVQAMIPGGGSIMSDPFVRLQEFFIDIVDDNNAEFGRPLCEVKTINTLSGYVLCADGEIQSSSATGGELAEIESYMTGGFFYE